MHGRRLATTEEIITITSPDSDQTLARLEGWANDHGIDVTAIEVGEDLGDAYHEERATLGVTLGGDGTYLEGIKTFGPRGIPLLGVNTGTLAFLARVDPGDLEVALDEVIRGRSTVDSRQQLYAKAKGVETMGINDVMIQHVPPDNPVDRKVTRLHAYVGDEYIGEYEGTGLAISTPTGSTGISLSADGPIHYPIDNPTLQIVPLHTHHIGVRPVVVGADTEIRVVSEGPANLLVDGGRSHTILQPEDVVRITGADQPAYVVRTSFDDQFFTAIDDKLGWSIRSDTDGPRERLEEERPRRSEPEDLVDRAMQIALEAAESAGEVLRERHGQVESVEFKTDKSDIVTEADYQSDRIITTVIENEFPDHSIFSEESERREGDSDYLWLIDPLDGTGNFAHGNPNYSISIALIEDGKPVMGVVSVPETGEQFCARIDGDAEENDVVLHTTDREHLDESMLLSGYDPDGSFLSHFYQEARGVRRLGSAALNLAYLAAGSADAVWEYDTYPWDVAGGLVIARAAGATVTNARGEPYELELDGQDHRTELLASNGPLHPALLEHLEREEEETLTSD